VAAAARLGAFASGLRTGDIPPPVLDAAVLHVLDVLGCGLAASGLGEVPWVTQSLDADARGRSSAIGVAHGVGPADAALVNGMLCHALDFDDTHPAAIVHASAVVVPAALAVAEARSACGDEVLTAIVAGNEVAIRLGMAAGTAFHARGLHSTGVCGVFGATAAAARLHDLSAAQTTAALGLAASMASGTLEFLADGSQTKPMHAGWAAHAGVLAARFAAHGARGPATALDGDRGLFAAYLRGEACDLDAQLDDLGERWETPNLAFKLHPVCHYIHAALDALGDLRRTHPLTPDQVASIVVLADEITIALVLDPPATKRAPRTPYDAKFSLPYCLAAQVVTGRLDVGSFTDEAITRSDVLRLAEKVTHEVLHRGKHDGGNRENEMLGGVRVTLVDGTVLEAPPRHARGTGAGPPIQAQDVLDKFRANASMARPEQSVEALERAILALRRGGHLEGLRLLRRG
jgi:2-methylcitrate dehydratase PrpD